MYSSDRMKTLIRFVKAYDKNFVFMNYQMHCLDIYMRRKEILLIFFRHFVAMNQPLLDYFWDISRDWERLQGTTTLRERLIKKKNRPNVISIPHYSYVSLNGYTWSFRVNEKAWARSVMLMFAIFYVFHNRQSTRNTFLPSSKTTYHARLARAHNLFSHPPFRMDSLYMYTFFSFH